MIRASGSNSMGQCSASGHKTGANSHLFQYEIEVDVPFPTNSLRAVHCGKQHSLFLTKCGQVFACGNNRNDQLGFGEEIDEVFDAQRVSSLEYFKVSSISTFSSFSLFVTNEGQVYGVGLNDSFQLGLSNTKRIVKPQLISFTVPSSSSISNSDKDDTVPIIQCAAGENHSLFLSRDHRVFGCGDNELGQLGMGDNFEAGEVISPVELLWSTSLKERGLTVAASSTGAKYISTGAHHSAIITNDNSILVSGSNTYGQCGVAWDIKSVTSFHLVTTVDHAFLKGIKISCGRRHTLVLDEDHRVWAFGDNSFGQLAIHEEEKGVCYPTDITNRMEHLMDTDEIITDIEAGFNYSMFITSNGKVIACGSNAEHKLGVRDQSTGDNSTKIRTPHLVYSLKETQNRIHIACGFFHSMLYEVSPE